LPKTVISTFKLNASLTEIVEILESNFGNIKRGEAFIKVSYTMKQGQMETV